MKEEGQTSGNERERRMRTRNGERNKKGDMNKEKEMRTEAE